MAKKIWISTILILAIIAAGVILTSLWRKNNAGDDTNNNINQENSDKTGEPQTQGSLGDHICLALFQVKRGEEAATSTEIFPVESFRKFGSGAFFGKIKDFQPGQNRQFAAFINQMMEEGQVDTYVHLRADVCLYRQDLLNPENGATLNYYVEHLYCTNSCQTGKYDIEVNLDTDGNFIGYRQGNIY
jgi:hypothetical protein